MIIGSFMIVLWLMVMMFSPAHLSEDINSSRSKAQQAQIQSTSLASSGLRRGGSTDTTEEHPILLPMSMLERGGKEIWMKTQRDFFLHNGGFDSSISFANKDIIHLNGGPRPLSFVLKDSAASITVVEPLAELYLSSLPSGKMTDDYLELERMHPVFSKPPELEIAELIGTADCVLLTISSTASHNLAKTLHTAHRYLKKDGFVYLIVNLMSEESIHQSQVASHSMIASIFSLGLGLHKSVSQASLQFSRGACVMPYNVTALSFKSCYFILKEQ